MKRALLDINVLVALLDPDQVHHGRARSWLSILDRTIVNHVRIHGPKQVTDVYLLALAVEHATRFVTFDAAVPLSAVVATKKEHLAVI